MTDRPPDASGHPSRRRICTQLAGLGSLVVAGCTPLQALNGLAPNRLAEAGIAYGPDPRQRLDVYRPKGQGPFPVAMFVYGGSWEFGDRAMYRFVGAALAAAGFLTIIPDYRLYPEIRYPDFLQDCALAFAWTRRETPGLGGGTERAWLIGHSAGAYNVAMLTLDPRWLAGAGLSTAADLRGTVALAGPYDFLPIRSPTLRLIFAPAVPATESQPIDHVDGRAPPMLLLAGRSDRTVDPGNTTRLAARIRAAGGLVQERLYSGVDHRTIIGAFGPPFGFLAPSLRDSLAFMRG